MVGSENDDRVVAQPECVQLVEEDPQPAVGHGDLGCIDIAQPGYHLRRACFAEPEAHGAVERDPGLGSAVAAVAVEVDVAPGRCPGLVRFEGVDDQRERLSAERPLEHRGPCRVRACRQRARFIAPVAGCPRDVAAHLLVQARDACFRQEPAVDVASGHGLEALGAHPAARVRKEVEARSKTAEDAGVDEEGVVGHVRGPVATPPHHARERASRVGDRGPAGRAKQARIRTPAAKREHSASGHDRPTRRDRRHRLVEDTREAQTPTRQPVDVGRPRAPAICADVIGTQRVEHQEHHVRALANRVRVGVCRSRPDDRHACRDRAERGRQLSTNHHRRREAGARRSARSTCPRGGVPHQGRSPPPASARRRTPESTRRPPRP